MRVPFIYRPMHSEKYKGKLIGSHGLVFQLTSGRIRYIDSIRQIFPNTTDGGYNV